MDEKNLFKIALICSLIGILIILLISESIVVPTIKIYEINKELLEKQVKISGKVSNTKYLKGLVSFDLIDDTGKIKVIAYEEEIDIKNNLEIAVEGTIKEYQNLLEIEAMEIRLI